jgi:hypothetical protein
MNLGLKYWFSQHTDFLYTLIFKKGLFYIDLWSLVHLWSGLVLFAILASMNVRHRWIWFFSLITLYEVAEVAFIYFTLNIFRPERLNDQIMDIFVGAVAALMCNYLLKLKSAKNWINYRPNWILIVFSALTFAFVWVGNYKYEYNVHIFNTKGLNIWAFILWTIGGFVILTFYAKIKKRRISYFRRVGFTWLFYVGCILTLEFIGFYLLNIHEVSIPDSKPLIFGLIHGNLVLHIYYIIFPFLVILFYEVLISLAKRAQYNLISENYSFKSGLVKNET